MAAKLTVRGSDGLFTLDDLPDMKLDTSLPKDPGTCKVMMYSLDGSHFAWCNGAQVNIIETGNGLKPKAQIPRPRCLQLCFSPRCTQLATWEIYAVKKGDGNGQGPPNVCIWSIETGKLLQSWINRSPDGWEPQWTGDDAWLLRGVTNQVHFYDATDFSKGVVKKCVAKGMSFFRASLGKGASSIAAFIPSIKGAPAAVRLFVDPDFEKPVTAKNFFKADRVDITWNKPGNACLVKTATETDTTGKSYYGETNLYYMSAKTGDSIHVQLDKEGPFYDFDWHPNGEEFAVVYGYMPAKVMLFDKNCNKIRDFGTGPRSTVKFSPHGNLLMFGGFGNLASGEMQFWSRKDFNLVNQLEAPATTIFEWCPDSEHIMTATHSPRLKVDNGFTVWKYCEAKPVFKSDLKELTGICWKPVPEGTFTEQPIKHTVKKFGGKPANFVAQKKQAYRPPGARGTESTIKLHEVDLGDAAKEENTSLSKAALKNKRKREAKAKAAAQAKLQAEGGVPVKKQSEEMKAAIAMVAKADAPKSEPVAPAQDTEKKIRNLSKKLRQIDSLIERRDAGEQLQVNQLDKIEDRGKVESEIAELKAKLDAL